jgi:Uma2 family endonuclease
VNPDAFIVYPDSDGKPMADNTKQARWIMVLFGNLLALFRDTPNVFVAADLFWYPVPGQPDVRTTPDVLVAFGRPKGDRGSYKQWEEGDVPLTVVFEVLSPGNTVAEMIKKQAFYEDHGVEEYYLYDPDSNLLAVHIRQGETFRRVRQINGFVSPRLGIRFDLSGEEMRVYYPDGKPFLTFEETRTALEQAEQRLEQAEQRVARAEEHTRRLTELTRKVLLGEATLEERAELQRLVGSPPSTSS